MKAVISPFQHGELKLRMLEFEDLPMTLAWRNRDDVRVWFKTSEIIDKDQHLNWFKQYVDKPNDYVFIVIADGKPVGQVAIYDISPETRAAEVGRFIAAPGETGKGYMRAAITALLDVARNQLGLLSVNLQVLAHNERAIRLYQRLGFKQDRTLDDMLVLSMRMQP